jgi:hypothetical protein
LLLLRLLRRVFLRDGLGAAAGAAAVRLAAVVIAQAPASMEHISSI